MITDQEFFLALYRDARTLPTPAFQKSAVRMLGQRVRFVAAVWGSGYFLGPNPASGMKTIPALCYNQETDPAGHEEWKQINRADKAIPIFFGNPFVSHALHTPTFFHGRHDSVMRDYARRYGRQCLLGTALTAHDSPVVEWCSLFRPDAGDVFTEGERAHCQSLVLHLSEALKVNQIVQSAGVACVVSNGEEGRSALASTEGTLLAAQEGFLAACRLQWHDFDGGRMPADVMRRIAGTETDVYRAQRVDIHIRRVSDLLLLTANPPARHAPLPPRRMEVALLFARGKSSKEIARDLLLYSSTVRNHIAASYRDLNVSNRMALKAELDEAARRIAASSFK